MKVSAHLCLSPLWPARTCFHGNICCCSCWREHEGLYCEQQRLANHNCDCLRQRQPLPITTRSVRFRLFVPSQISVEYINNN